MKINDRKFPIKCPNSECGVEVTDAEIREIVGDKAYEEYQEKAFKNYIDTNADTV
jgi:deoxycytidylate deaminase